MPKPMPQRAEARTIPSHMARATALARWEARQATTTSSNIRPQSLKPESEDVTTTALSGSSASLAPTSTSPERTRLLDFFKVILGQNENSLHRAGNQPKNELSKN